MKTLNKNLFTSGLAIAMVCAMALPAFADNSNSNFFVPQSVEAIIEHNENGEIYYECRWRDDNGIATIANLSDAEWVEHTFDGLPLKHRAAKEPLANKVRAASETVYALRHYSRAQIVQAVGGTVLVDSDRQYANSGTFLEKINQSLDIQYFCGSESFAPDNINIFEHDGTNYITVNQLLLNKEAFNAERIPLHCGNGFDETSYIVSPDYHISVILGSNYLKYFNIGDVISALNYYEVPTYMVVQGFAEKGACATVNGVTIDLDNYIITASPLFNFMPESFDETRYHGLLYFQKIDSYFMLKKASNIVDIIAGLDNISTANNMFPMYIQAYSPYYQMYIRFICRQPLVVDIFLFVLLLLGALICQCYIIHLSRAVTSKCFDLKLLLFYPFFDFCMILFFFILGELMSMNKDFLISASLILTLTFIFLSDIALIILFQSKSKSQISLCQK